MKVRIASIIGEGQDKFGVNGYIIRYESGQKAVITKSDLQKFVKSGDYYIINAKDYPPIYKYQI